MKVLIAVFAESGLVLTGVAMRLDKRRALPNTLFDNFMKTVE
jgi:hypothetical protein